MCVFQPGNFTGCGSDGVNKMDYKRYHSVWLRCEPVWPSGKAFGSPFSSKKVVVCVHCPVTLSFAS